MRVVDFTCRDYVCLLLFTRLLQSQQMCCRLLISPPSYQYPLCYYFLVVARRNDPRVSVKDKYIDRIHES